MRRRGSSPMLRWIDARHEQLTAIDLMTFDVLRLEVGNDLGEQRLGTLAIIAAEITDIDIERDRGNFRPGVQGQVRLGKNDGAGDPGGITRRIAEGVKQLADDSQLMALAGGDGKATQVLGIVQPDWRAAAIVEVGDQVQAIHDAVILVRFTWNPLGKNGFKQSAKAVTGIDDLLVGQGM